MSFQGWSLNSTLRAWIAGLAITAFLLLVMGGSHPTTAQEKKQAGEAAKAAAILL